MKVFISWSGARSKGASIAFCTLLEDTIQRAETWFSGRDIQRGSLGVYELIKALAECDMGVLMVTQENYLSPWIHFEAGAIINAYQQDPMSTKACPILLDINRTTLEAPLKELQTTDHTKPDMLELLKTINVNLPLHERIDEGKLIRNFDKQWPHYEQEITKVLSQFPLVAASSLPSLLPPTAQSTDLSNDIADIRKMLLELKSDLLPGNLRDWNSFVLEVRRLRMTTYALVMNAAGFVRDNVLYIIISSLQPEVEGYMKQPENSAAILRAAKATFPAVSSFEVVKA